MHIDTLPVSVIETKKQDISQRRKGEHGAVSSRADPSPFPSEIATLCAQLYLREAQTVVDPFAGWGERSAAVRAAGKQYVGVDKSPYAIDFARDNFGAANTLGDSLAHAFPPHGGLLTCPPYWNLERYEGDGLSSARSWSQFCEWYDRVLTNCASSASESATYCIMVGSWRSGGVHYDLPHATKLIMYGLGFNFHDSVVVSRLARTKVKIMLPQAVRLGYTVRAHEELLVFRRGPTDKNAEAYLDRVSIQY